MPRLESMWGRFGPFACLVLLLSACGQQGSDTPPPAQTAEPAATAEAPSTKPCNLTVGWDPWEPYRYEAVDGEVAGMDVDLVRLIAKGADCTVRFKRGNWRDLLVALKAGQVDVLMAATATEERKAFARFSEPYRNEVFALMTRSENREAHTGRTVGALARAGLTIGVTDGYFYGDPIHDLMADPELESRFLLAAVPELNFRRLLDSQVDVVLGDPYVATAVLRRNGRTADVARLPDDVRAGPVSFMYSKFSVPTDEVARMDRALTAAKADGSIEAILARYLGDNGG